MKRDPASFFASCRKGLIVALLVTNLSGCASNSSNLAPGHAVLYPLGVITVPIWVPVLFTYGTISYAIGQAAREKEDRIYSNAGQVQELLVQKARAYLKTSCEQDERLFIKPGITLGEDNKLLILRRDDAPLPLLKTAPKEAAPAALIKYRTFHYNEFRFQSTRRFREIQYGYGIPWDDDATLDAAWDVFPSSAAEEPKFFIETGKGKYIQRASYSFWKQAGLREQVFKDSPQMQEWRLEKGRYYLSEADFFQKYGNPWDDSLFDLPVDAPDARYALLVEDISTLEDRTHWVARGRLRLIEQESGEVVAEYVGFAANLGPGMQAKSPSRRWEDDTESGYWNEIESGGYWTETIWVPTGVTELCPNAAENPRMIVRSFLQKILDAKQP
jgi:hypothetical protein